MLQEKPIVQGGMGWVGAELPAAVSNAGGCGMVTAGSHAQAGGLAGLRELVRECQSLTDKPFGVNFLLLNSAEDYNATAQVVIEEGVKVVETAGRPPPPELLQRLHDAGVAVIHKVTTVRHALAAEKAGVDMVEVAGFDLCGHPGEKDLGNWIMFAKAGRVLSIPWIAAGGTADGSQLAAALGFGASGVNMGTQTNTALGCTSHLKLIILPRRARDTHKENSKLEHGVSRHGLHGDAGLQDRREHQAGLGQRQRGRHRAIKARLQHVTRV